MTVQFEVEGAPVTVEVVRRRPDLVVRVDGREYSVGNPRPAGEDGVLTIDGKAVPYRSALDGDTAHVQVADSFLAVRWIDPREQAGGQTAGDREIRSPMPGLVVTVHRQPGEAVSAGETVLTIESMKLQTSLTAPADGVVAAINKSEGQTFEKGEVLAVLDLEPPEAEKEGAI